MTTRKQIIKFWIKIYTHSYYAILAVMETCSSVLWNYLFIQLTYFENTERNTHRVPQTWMMPDGNSGLSETIRDEIENRGPRERERKSFGFHLIPQMNSLILN